MSKKNENLSKGMMGNQNGTKLKESSIRQQAYKQYCEHIADGNPKEAWCFKHPELTCTFKTMEKYIKENPAEFPSIHKEMAEAESYGKWFNTGKQMMLGGVDKCHPVIYQMIMRNKFGWDKEQKYTHSVEPEVRKLLERFEKE